MTYGRQSMGRIQVTTLGSKRAASPNVVQTVSLLRAFPLDLRQIRLSASIMIGIANCVRIPNPTVSASVNARVPTQSTSLLSSNGRRPGILSSQEFPSRACVKTGIVIQMLVTGFAPGLVNVVS